MHAKKQAVFPSLRKKPVGAVGQQAPVGVTDKIHQPELKKRIRDRLQTFV